MDNPLPRAVIVFGICAAVCLDGAAAEPASNSIVKLLVRDKVTRSIVGELLSETDKEVVVAVIPSGVEQTLAKASLGSIKRDLSDSELTAAIGLPGFLAWKIRKTMPTETPNGVIAKVDGAVIYVTIGSRHRIQAEDALFVYRGVEAIKDPLTGEEIGRQRRRIAKLAIVEVQEKFSKAKLTGDLEVTFEVGDIVEVAKYSRSIAVVPMLSVSGDVSSAGQKLAESLTTDLVNAKISVVERSRSETILSELAIQQSGLIDPKTIQKAGKQLGAYAVLAGTLISKGKYSEAEIRFIEVESGEILFATRYRIDGDDNLLSEENAAPQAELNALAKELLVGTWQINYGGGSTYVDLIFHANGKWNAIDLRAKKLGLNEGKVGGKWKCVGDTVVAEDHWIKYEGKRIMSRYPTNQGQVVRVK